MVNLVIDDFDIFFFVRMHRASQENQDITTNTIAKEFFNCKDQDNNFITTKINFVKSRLKKLEKEGIILTKRNSVKRIFILNNERVVFKKYKNPDGKLIDCFCLKDSKNRWNIYQI